MMGRLKKLYFTTPKILGEKPKKVEKDKEIKKSTVITPETDSNKILIWINTFNRPDDLKLLLDDIYKNKKEYNVQVLVIDDFSDKSYNDCISTFNGKLNIKYIKTGKNHGKHLYWKLCSYVMSIIKGYDFDYVIKFDDDLRLEDNIFEKCINIWNTIKDPKKICLNFRLDNREGKTCWTGIKPKRIRMPIGDVYLSQWVDCDFFVTKKFFEALNWEITPISTSRWRNNPNKSSGVGQKISHALHKKYNLYLTTESLVQHKEHISFMNEEERKKNPLLTKPFKNKNYGEKNAK